RLTEVPASIHRPIPLHVLRVRRVGFPATLRSEISGGVSRTVMFVIRVEGRWGRSDCRRSLRYKAATACRIRSFVLQVSSPWEYSPHSDYSLNSIDFHDHANPENCRRVWASIARGASAEGHLTGYASLALRFRSYVSVASGARVTESNTGND